MPDYYDAIIMNACFGNFYNPRDVLALFSGHSSTATTTSTTTTTSSSSSSSSGGGNPLIFISHPLGAAFVQDLHNQDATTVPHTLPSSPLEMVHQWTFGLPGILPMAMAATTTTTPSSNSSSSSSSSYYLMTLKRLDRATTLPQIQRYRGVVDTGYGRGGKKLGVPTANLPSRLFQDALTTVDTGVYFGWATLEHLWVDNNNNDNDNHRRRTTRIFKAVVNVGYSPTFEGAENKEKIIEAHLIVEDDDDGDSSQGLTDFYGQVMRLELSGYLRPEKKFQSFGELVHQIHADIHEASTALDGSPYVELRDSSELLRGGVVEQQQQGTTLLPWVGSSGGDATASWEFVANHRDVLRTLRL